jgi:hypothetical protein
MNPWFTPPMIPELSASNVDAFYNKTIVAIGTVDQNHTMFMEPSNSMYAINTPFDSKIVWEPHFDPLSFYSDYYPENITMLRADIAAEYREYILRASTPI